MANRFEWMDRPGDEPAPEQYVAIVNALGDWIEADLQAVFDLGQKVGDRSWAEISAELTAADNRQKAAKADAKRRAIEAGYVWRLDIDP